MNKLNKLGLTCLLAVGLAASAHAVALDGTSLLGTWDPASDWNNPADSTTATNVLVNWENGTIPNPNPNPTNTVYALGAGFANWLPEATFVDKDDNANDGFGPIDAGLYDYVLLKYGNVAYVHYLGNLADGLYDLNLKEFADGSGQGLSHASWFTPGGTSVPDGGTTAVLLGLSLVGLSFIARRRAA